MRRKKTVLTLVGNIKKQVAIATCPSKFGSGGWIRTNDLRVMSPTSYLCSTPHYFQFAKVQLFLYSTKLF